MAALLWLLLLLLLLLLVAFVTALSSSAKLRKNAFIWFSYATITGWYYFRVLYKKYCNKDEVTSPRSSNSRNSCKTQATSFTKEDTEGLLDPDLIYFEPREVVERRQLERSGSSHLSDSASSGGFDGTAATTVKHKRRGLFHSRRKAAAEEAMRRVSDASCADTNSGASESNAPVSNSATRRTYTGRKKPASWAD